VQFFRNKAIAHKVAQNTDRKAVRHHERFRASIA
jgi:hypothetical protein